VIPTSRPAPGPRPVAKCLIVDDREENILALRALLRDDDVELLEARSGREALELLLEHEVALLLLDVQMPEMDGFEVAELVRGSERTRDVPIIFITAGAHDQTRIFKGYESGAVDFLHKPVDGAILRNKAAVFFELHRRKAQVALELREREKALRLNEMFMAVLGHDLRSPLNAVRMGAELLQRASNEAGVKEISARILSSTSHMVTMIEDLLDVARARSGTGFPVDRQPADIGEVVQRTVQEQKLLHPERDIRIEACGDLRGRWDAGRLRQLATNLLANAVKHGTPGEPVQVELDGAQADCVRLCVRNGGDIAPEAMQSLFDPFRGSGDRLGRRHEGLGLGLYIAQQIVAAHGGSICLASPAPGTITVTATLPRG
jgi:two-component system sensor histidine kinase/response regulator